MYLRCAVWSFVFGIFLPLANTALPRDADLDGDVDLPDLAALEACLDGPGETLLPLCMEFDNLVDQVWHEDVPFQGPPGLGNGIKPKSDNREKH